MSKDIFCFFSDSSVDIITNSSTTIFVHEGQALDMIEGVFDRFGDKFTRSHKEMYIYSWETLCIDERRCILETILFEDLDYNDDLFEFVENFNIDLDHYIERIGNNPNSNWDWEKELFVNIDYLKEEEVFLLINEIDPDNKMLFVISENGTELQEEVKSVVRKSCSWVLGYKDDMERLRNL